MLKISVLTLVGITVIAVLAYTYFVANADLASVRVLDGTQAKPTSQIEPAAKTQRNTTLHLQAAGSTSDPQTPSPRADTERSRGATTNLILASDNFAHASWRREHVSVEVDAATAPNGSRKANRITETTDDGLHRIETVVNGATADAAHTFSLFVKPAGRAELMFEMRDSPTGKYGTVRFDLSKGTTFLESGDVVNAGVQAQAAGWYRCWASMPFSSQQTVFNFALLNSDGGPNYRGDGKSSLLVWGAQFEAAPRPSDYIPSEP